MVVTAKVQKARGAGKSEVRALVHPHGPCVDDRVRRQRVRERWFSSDF